MLQIKLAAADDLDNDVEVISEEMQQQILAIIGKQFLPLMLCLLASAFRSAFLPYCESQPPSLLFNTSETQARPIERPARGGYGAWIYHFEHRTLQNPRWPRKSPINRANRMQQHFTFSIHLSIQASFRSHSKSQLQVKHSAYQSRVLRVLARHCWMFDQMSLQRATPSGLWSA